jgi:hypothetical protein
MMNFSGGIKTSFILTPLPKSSVFVGGKWTFFA